jgi:hypothetical protein
LWATFASQSWGTCWPNSAHFPAFARWSWFTGQSALASQSLPTVLARGARLSWRTGWSNFTWLTLLALRSQGTVFTLVALLTWQTQFALLTWWSWVALLAWQAWFAIAHHRQTFCHLGRELGQSRLNGRVAGRLQFQDLNSKFSRCLRKLRNNQLTLTPEIVFLRRKQIANDVVPYINRNVARL